jgi:hypothetical protein
MALLFFMSPLVILSRTVALPGISYYYFSPIFPITALGLTAFVVTAIPRILEFVQDGLTALFTWLKWSKGARYFLALSNVLALFLLVVGPLLFQLVNQLGQVNGTMTTLYDPILIKADDAWRVAGYVNQHTQPGDLVIASPAIAWMFKANVADYQVTLAADGIKTMHFPDDIPAYRFAFAAGYRNARFVVVDLVWHNWASVNMPPVKTLLDDVQTWPVAMSSGDITVYQNPH